MLASSGAVTADSPSSPTLVITGPLGGQLIGTSGGSLGTTAPRSIVAIKSDGSSTTLEQSVPGSSSLNTTSIVGRDDGGAWAWSVDTNTPACGSTANATADIYTDDGTGARKLAQVSLGGGVTTISLVTFTLAGIVASGTNACGGFGSSTLSMSPSVMVDPASGATVDLASRMGAGCEFKDLADDGTVICVVGGVNPNKPYNPSDPLTGPTLRVVSPSGQQTDRPISSLLSTQCVALNSGNELISADAAVMAVSAGCMSSNSSLPFIILHLLTGEVTVPQGNQPVLAPVLWTPDDVLIAADYVHHTTSRVTEMGTVTEINSTYAAQTA